MKKGDTDSMCPWLSDYEMCWAKRRNRKIKLANKKR